MPIDKIESFEALSEKINGDLEGNVKITRAFFIRVVA
jgi:hypothetical protein